MLITRYSAIHPPLLLFNGSIVISHQESNASEFLKYCYRQLNFSYPKFFKMDNLCKLAFLSAEVLLKDSGLGAVYTPEETGLIILNAFSSLDSDEKHQESINNRENYFPSPSVFVYTLPNIMTGEIAIRHKIKGENGVFITEKPDHDLLFETVNELFEQKRVSCCIAGWVDAYCENLRSCLMLLEREENVKRVSQAEELIIFDPLNIERIFKKVLQDGTY